MQRDSAWQCYKGRRLSKRKKAFFHLWAWKTFEYLKNNVAGVTTSVDLQSYQVW